MKPNLTLYIGYIRELWKKLGINQRISLVLMFLISAGVFIGVLFWAHRPEYALLFARLEQTDASEIVEKLRDMKVPYQLKAGGRSVYVPTDQVYELRLEFAGEGIPQGKGIGFEIFDRTNFGITDFVQKMNYLRAVQGEIARTISNLEEVVSARVHIVIPHEELFTENEKVATASIALTIKSGAVLDKEQINGIRYLTACAVEGLDYKNITMIDQYGNILSKNSDPDGNNLLSSNQLDLQKNVESYFSTKVQSMLEAVLGMNSAIVRVNADLNFEQIEVTEENFDPESAVVRTEHISSEKSSGKSGLGGVVGAAANIDKKSNVEAQPGEENQHQSETIKNPYEIDHKVQKIVQNVGDVTKLSAAIFIRKLTDAQGKYIERQANEMTRIEDIIKSAIGFSADRGDRVVVKEIVFNDDEINVQEKKLQESQKWTYIMTALRTVAIVILIITVLIIFKNLIKKSRLDEGSGGGLIAAGSIDNVKEDEIENITLDDLTSSQMPLSELENRKKASLYQQAISKIATEQPDNIVQILKSWLTEK